MLELALQYQRSKQLHSTDSNDRIGLEYHGNIIQCVRKEPMKEGLLVCTRCSSFHKRAHQSVDSGGGRVGPPRLTVQQRPRPGHGSPVCGDQRFSEAIRGNPLPKIKKGQLGISGRPGVSWLSARGRLAG